MKKLLTSALLLTSLFLASKEDVQAKGHNSKKIKKALAANGVGSLSTLYNGIDTIDGKEVSQLMVSGRYQGQHVFAVAYDKNKNGRYEINEIDMLSKHDGSCQQAVVYSYDWPETTSIFSLADFIESTRNTAFGLTKLKIFNPDNIMGAKIPGIKEFLQEPLPKP